MQSAEKTTEDTVLIVEDDEAFSAALHRLFRTIGLRVEVFESATALLKCPRLTPREREVMSLVAAGLLNKQIAGELGLSEITVKIHRGHAMKKMRPAP